jgi:hypothetical protein
MAKFQTWYAEHESQVASKNDAHKKAQAAKKVYVPVVKKVAEPVAEVVAEEEVANATDESAQVSAPAAEVAAEETPAAE